MVREVQEQVNFNRLESNIEDLSNLEGVLGVRAGDPIVQGGPRGAGGRRAPLPRPPCQGGGRAGRAASGAPGPEDIQY